MQINPENWMLQEGLTHPESQCPKVGSSRNIAQLKLDAANAPIDAKSYLDPELRARLR